MKQLIIQGQAIGSIWKTDKPQTELKSNNQHDGGKKAALFIPENYADPTASAAIRNIIREQKLEQRQKKRRQKK